MNVPEWPIATERERELLQEVLESHVWGGYHPFVNRLEREFASFQQCRYGVAATNGTVTLEAALEVLGVGPGDEVIVPAISFVATATAVSRTGATPVFVDIEPDTFNVSPDCVANAVTKETAAIIAVHFGGSMADMDRLFAIAKDAGAFLIEDAAHAHGSEWNGKRAGSIGLLGSFSFQNSKVMTSGEGGMLTSNDETFSERVRSLIDQGRRPGEGWFHHFDLGTNYRLTAWQAAVLLAQLERLPDQNRTRARNAAILRNALRDEPDICMQTIPEAAKIQTNYLFLGRVRIDRDAFRAHLVKTGVPCTSFYPHPLYGNPVYQRGGCRVTPCPVAEQCVHDAFWLPHRVLLGSEELTHEIAAVIKTALHHQSQS